MTQLFNIKIFSIIKIIYFIAINILNQKNRKFYLYLFKNKQSSKSQIFQDLFVIYFSYFKKNGFFIEIGGGDGTNLSNTFVLEKKYHWKGIICEPNPIHKNKILLSRNAKLEQAMIGSKNEFRNLYLKKDSYAGTAIRSKNIIKKIKIKSINLNYFFAMHKIKKKVDYISIDTEGNEYEIIKNFNFKKHQVNIFTIEHNFNNKKREKIKKIMMRNNYKNIFSHLSYMDDWYIKNEN